MDYTAEAAAEHDEDQKRDEVEFVFGVSLSEEIWTIINLSS